MHKELLFSEESLEPDLYKNSKKKIKLSNSFILEDELEPKKHFFKKGSHPLPKNEFNSSRGNTFHNNQQNNSSWRKNEFEDPGFFDNFKGKSDEIQVITFKRNMGLVPSNENSFAITNCIFRDYLGIT
jgi:hypothetical protein